MFAVIKVVQYYDEIAELDCIGSFETEADANVFVQKMKDDDDNASLRRWNYIQGYVDALEITSENEQRLISKYSCNRHVAPSDYKEQIKNFLRSNPSFKDNGYNPPPANTTWMQYFVVPVPPVESNVSNRGD